MPTKTYPIAGTNADRILQTITEKPGISVTGLVNALGMNPSPTRQCIKALLEHGMIEDRPDPQAHHYFRKALAI